MAQPPIWFLQGARGGRVAPLPVPDPSMLPPDLPVPGDDGAADHLPGIRVPPDPPATSGDVVVGPAGSGTGTPPRCSARRGRRCAASRCGSRLRWRPGPG